MYSSQTKKETGHFTGLFFLFLLNETYFSTTTIVLIFDSNSHFAR